MTTVIIYRNKRNPNKYIEIHNDGHYHNSLKQYMYWKRNIITGELLQNPIKNMMGDGNFHRCKKSSLTELLKDYELMENLF